MKAKLVNLLVRFLLKISGEKEIISEVLTVCYPGEFLEVTVRCMNEDELDQYWDEMQDLDEEDSSPGTVKIFH